MIRGLLTGKEWSFFEPFILSPGPHGGRPARDHRRVLNTIFWIARTGAPWRDLPAELGSWNSAFRQFRQRTASALWDVMLVALADGGGDADLLQMIDRTSVRAHHCAAGERGDSSTGSWALARRLHEQAPHPQQRAWPAHRLPRDCAGQEAGCSSYDALMEARDSDPGVMLGETGYDSCPLSQDLRDRGAVPEISSKRNRHVQHCVSRPLYALRSRLECFANRLKNRRRVATRYDKTADSFLSFVALFSIRLWIRFVHAA